MLEFIKDLSEEECIQYLEKIRWDGKVISPFDADSKVYKCTHGDYKCNTTGKYFNVKTGSIFEDTKTPIKKWLMGLYIFSNRKYSISSYQLAKEIQITQKSAWFMLYRFFYMFKNQIFQNQISEIIKNEPEFILSKIRTLRKYKRDNSVVEKEDAQSQIERPIREEYNPYLTPYKGKEIKHG